MCCDTCPKYDECEEKNKLSDDCCPECPEYEYCMGGEKNRDGGEGYQEDDDTPSDYEKPFEY